MTKGLWAYGLLALLGLSGCRREGPCARLYERLAACDKRPGVSLGEFLKLCRQQRKEGEDRTFCVRERDCEALVACLRRADEKAEEARLLAALEEARRRHRPGGLLRTCRERLAGRHVDPALRAKCRGLAEDTFERLAAALKKRRARPGPGASASACRRFGEAAALLGRQQEARILCEELRYAAEIASVLAHVEEAKAQAAPTLPLRCHVVLEMLSRVRHETGWLKEQRRRVAAACYHDLGERILAWALARRQPRCPPVLEALLGELERYGTPVPQRLLAPLRKAWRRCRPEQAELPAFLLTGTGPRALPRGGR